MNDPHDDYLWTGEGPVSLEVAAMERELRSLRWTPRELALPQAVPAVELRGGAATPARPASARAWVPLVAGLAAAAAVLATLMWLRDPGESPGSTQPAPSVQPSGRPSPDLKDPFGSDAPAVPVPSASPHDLKDPFGDEPPRRRSVSPDLKDPFSNGSESAPEPRPPLPPSAPSPKSPDLMDPFDNDATPPRGAGELHDPFAGKPVEPPKSSPDLKDPFRR